MKTRAVTLPNCGLLLLGASLYTLAFPPYSQSWAAWFALAPLFFVIRHTSGKGAFFFGLSYGLLWCMGQGYWLYWTMIDNFALRPLVALPFLLANFIFFSGLPTSLVTGLSHLIMTRSSPLLSALCVPALWVSGEFLRANPLFGVSWGVLGYTQQQQLLLIQIADLTGVYGVSFLLALSGYVVAQLGQALLTRRKKQTSRAHNLLRKSWNLEPVTWSALRPALGLFLGAVIFTCGYGALRLHQYASTSATPIRVALIQGDVPAEHRWNPRHYAGTLLKYAAVTRRSLTDTRPDLAIWPEFAISFYLDKEPLLRAQLGEFARMLRTPLLLGAPRLEESEQGPQYYNSAYLFSAQGKFLDVYDKLRLVPFAEYRPFSLPHLLSNRPNAPSEFTPGVRPTIFTLPSGPFGATICYEATYPAITRRLVQAGAQWLVNISNDTWLGEAQAAVEQHFSMNVLRAVENRRSIARVATAGVSGFISPTGRVTILSSAKEGALHGEVSLQRNLTIYTQWGEWFSYSCLGFSLLVAAQAARRSRLAIDARQSPPHPSPTKTDPIAATI